MRYLLLIYGAENGEADMNQSEQRKMMQEYVDYTEALRSAGVMQGGEALQPTATATTVVDQGGSPLVTDGPFAETREQLGGFYLLDVPDLDAAIEWAHKCPGARSGKIELRPVVEFS